MHYDISNIRPIRVSPPQLPSGQPHPRRPQHIAFQFLPSPASVSTFPASLATSARRELPTSASERRADVLIIGSEPRRPLSQSGAERVTGPRSAAVRTGQDRHGEGSGTDRVGGTERVVSRGDSRLTAREREGGAGGWRGRNGPGCLRKCGRMRMF